MLPRVSLANSENFANLTLPSPSQVRRLECDSGPKWYPLRNNRKGPGREARHGGERCHGKRCLPKLDSAELKAFLRERSESLRIRTDEVRVCQDSSPDHSQSMPSGQSAMLGVCRLPAMKSLN